MAKRCSLPKYDCPNPDCDARNIFFATSTLAKNHTVLVLFADELSADFVFPCPKCKKLIAVTKIPEAM